jgi:acetylornithine deacetylase/succinyl-diaminopimelate desuccinylase-like protein
MAATPSSELLAELGAFLAIPSVSVEPAHEADMRRAAAWVAAELGWANGRVVETEGHPVVLAEWLGAAGAPTILVYGHYDVQPAGDESEWETPPFEPSVRDGRIYARGATDDKGPVVVALQTARRLLAATGALPLNVRFLIEGEEELGSPSLPGFLAAHRDLFADVSVVVSADGAMWRPGEPSVAVAAKGLVAFDLVVEGAATDLHSGRHGGAVQNPNHALAQLVASLHAEDGSVAVAGFYDDVEPLSSADREALARIPFDDESYRASIGAPELHGEPGWSTLERLWTRPTLEVNELRGGGAFTVIPRVSVRVETQPGAVPAYSIATDHPAVDAAVRALRHSYPDAEPLLVRIGGTLPAAAMFEEFLGLKTLLFSFSTSDEQLHAPNEFFRLSRIEEGIAAWSELWRLLA